MSAPLEGLGSDEGVYGFGILNEAQGIEVVKNLRPQPCCDLGPVYAEKLRKYREAQEQEQKKEQ